MKTKLLRKIRKRYEINYYPNGYDFGSGYDTNTECVALIDTGFWTFKASPIIHRVFLVGGTSKEYGFKECLNQLNNIIINKYDYYGTRRNKKLEKKEEKLWHVIK